MFAANRVHELSDNFVETASLKYRSEYNLVEYVLEVTFGNQDRNVPHVSINN